MALNTSPKGASAPRLVACGLLALIAACGALRAGPIGVVENQVLTDAARGRPVPLKIYYPEKEHPGGYPVVIFSHGAGGSKDTYGYLGRFWAENGYVVIHLDHVGSDQAILRSGQMAAAMKAAIEDPSNMVNRPLDAIFVLDSLPAIAAALPALRDRMDLTRIGVAGHSFGAYTAMALAGALIHLPGGATRTFTDPRVKAFIAMSPPGPGGLGFLADSWGALARPMLTISGSDDREVGGGSPAERLLPFQHMPPAGKFHVTVSGAGHFDFADHHLDGTLTPEKYHEFIKRIGLAFWDTALRENAPSGSGFARALGEEGIADEGGALSRAGMTGQLKSK